jgi:hypothetical protein
MLSFKAMVKTGEQQLRVDNIDPDVMSHILMVLSREQLTRMLGLSGLKATPITQSLLKHTKSVPKTTQKAFSRKGRDVPMTPQGRFRLNLAPILRFVELEKLDFAVFTPGYDHVVLQSDGVDW